MYFVPQFNNRIDGGGSLFNKPAAQYALTKI